MADHAAKPIPSLKQFARCATFAIFSLSGSAALASTCLGAAPDRHHVVTIEAKLGGVPALVRIPKEISKAPIVLWHGMGPPATEQMLMEALPLDEVPAIKVYLGLPLFGLRTPPGGREELARRQTEDLGRLLFEPVIVGAASELPAVVEALIEQQCLRRDDGIGLFGFSAGGAAALLALAERKVRIDTAVVINTSTGLNASVRAYERATGRHYAWSPYTRDLAHRTDAVERAADIAAGRPALLIVHGRNDAQLDPGSAVALHDALVPWYGKTDDAARLEIALLDGLPHAWPESPHAAELRRSIAAWFTRHASDT